MLVPNTVLKSRNNGVFVFFLLLFGDAYIIHGQAVVNPFFQDSGQFTYNVKITGHFPDSLPHFRKSILFLPKWSAENLPFFCKIEHRWGKESPVPIKFRLGSVEYVDWLEGKRSW